MGTVWDPRQDNADCDRCYLRVHRVGDPVRAEINEGSYGLVLAEAPGEDEVEIGRPLVGKSGQELDRSLSSQGVRRSDFSYTNVLSCRPKGNDLDLLLHQFKKENKARLAAGKDLLPTPQSCCRPRLLKELRQFDNVIALGKVGASAILGDVSIMDIRGGPINVQLSESGSAVWAVDGEEMEQIEGAHKLKVLPTLHPAFVMRARRWTRAFRADIGRAVRWFKNRRQWQDPEMLFVPSPDQLRQFFASASVFTYDVETTMAPNPMMVQLRCVGFCSGNRAVVVPQLSIDGVTKFYSSSDEIEIRSILRDFFVDPTKLKLTWNGGSFDVIVIEDNFEVTPSPHQDLILWHRGAEPELPHGLSYAGSVYSDAPSWKASHTATEARSDQELFVYNARDCAITEFVATPIVESCKLRGVEKAIEVHHEIQKVCVGMHRNGMFVDQRRRERLERIERFKAEKYTALCRKYSENDAFNPNSVPQVADLLFEKWKLPIPMPPAGASRSELSAARKKFFTKLGDPTTNDEMLRSLGTQNKLEKFQEKFIESLRLFRRASKRLGTYILKLAPMTSFIVEEQWFDEDETGEEKEARKKRIKDAKRGACLPDGRVHTHFNSHSVTTQRLSSSDPLNAQNFPNDLRSMIRAAPGHKLIGADSDQLELRTIASLAGASRYLDAFKEGRDPHSETAAMVFGRRFTDLPSYKTNKTAKNLRTLAKIIQYAAQYQAALPKITDIVRSTEDPKTGELPYRKLTMKEVGKFYDAWIESNPEIVAWWASLEDEYRSLGCLIEPVLNWRRDFLDGEDKNEMAAFKPSASGAAVIHLATLDFVKSVPFFKWGPGTGLICQVHDALVAEAPCCGYGNEHGEKHKAGCQAVQVAEAMSAAMNRTVPGMSVAFTAKAVIHSRWNKV